MSVLFKVTYNHETEEAEVHPTPYFESMPSAIQLDCINDAIIALEDMKK